MAEEIVSDFGRNGQERLLGAEDIAVRCLAGLSSLAEILIECPHVADLSGGTCVADLLNVLVKDAHECLIRDIDNALAAEPQA
ncbi:hypothetical protein [Desulfovibrio aminophilus]|uniref:hypothetical protein n=1 Tax=Desulfovibrio aminophilus TaxID=81425 RepID=UPI0004868DC4|nr:hypothetical protein [Desulfovibrio aminophilus]